MQEEFEDLVIQQNLNYFRGALDILGLLNEAATEIEGKIPAQKRFETLVNAIGQTYVTITDQHNKKVKDYLCVHIVVPNPGTTEQPLMAFTNSESKQANQEG